MAVSINKINVFVIICLILTAIHVQAINPDCESIRKEVSLFDSISPSGIHVYEPELRKCGIEYIQGIPLVDYFKTDQDVLLAYTYISFKSELTHDLLIDYMLKNKRWDLLLRTLDNARKMSRANQVLLLEKLFYQNLPGFFTMEMKEMFNFFSESEKLTVSQQLIPNNPKEIKHLNKQNNYIYKFWPLFDQMVYITNLRQFFPYQFEKLELFWRQKLVSYYYEAVESQDPSFKLLLMLLNQEVQEAPIQGANPSLQAYYYLKTNQFNRLDPLILNNKIVFFNLLRYFELYTPQQQVLLLSIRMPLDLSDIEHLFSAYFYQIDSYAFRSWVWDQAIQMKFNLETYFLNPGKFTAQLPFRLELQLKYLSPVSFWVKNNKDSKQHFFDNDPTNQTFARDLTKDQISTISRFYNDFKVLPYKQTGKVMRQILPFISIDSHKEFIRLVPYTSDVEQLDLIERFTFLELMPTRNRAQWWQSISSKFDK
ncbi:MAG: hypothetical protein VW397_05380 [Candidatus Margulisiibacteriota bacterium]